MDQSASWPLAGEEPPSARLSLRPGRPQLLRRTLIIFVPLALLLAAIMGLLYYMQIAAIGAVSRASERHAVEIGLQRTTATLAALASDARFLAATPAVGQWLDSGEGAARQALAEQFLIFVRERAAFDQVRLIGADGSEILRIDWNGGNPVVAPDALLRNVADAYYVQETLKLGPGEVYVSPFDLSVVDGAVEEPIKPIIRFGVPIYDAGGVRRGLVILNYLGERHLERFDRLAETVLGDLWLLNRDGYWLRGPAAEDEWAFMFPERRERAFARSFPKAWHRMRAAGPAGQFVAEGDLFTFVRIELGRGWFVPGSGETAESADSWYLVARVPAPTLTAQHLALVDDFLVASAPLLLLLATVSFVIARNGARRQEAEDRLRASESQALALLDSSPDAVVIADRDGRIVMVSAQTEKMFGHPRAHLIGQPVEMLLPERFRAAHSGYRGGYMAAPRVRTMGEGLELYGLRADGRELPVAVSLSPVMTGRRQLVVAAIRDITDRKAAEERLRASEARFRGVVDAAPDAIVITNTEGRIVLVGSQTERLFGHPRERLIGQPVEILVPERFRRSHVRHRQGYAAEPRFRAMGAGLELYGLRSDGTEFPVSVSLSPAETEEGRLLVSVIRDVTDALLVERQIKDLNDRLIRDNATLATVNKELEAFSYSVSHDLRAPLRAIDGFSQALLEDCADRLEPQDRSHLDRVRQAAQRMGTLIDDLLKLSRVSRADFAIEEVDLSAIARDVVEVLRAAHPDRPVECEIASDLTAQGDPRLLRIALQNLIENAWKFTAGRDPARVEFGQLAKDGELVFFVRDNGAGFDMAYADQLFRAFRRLHDPRTFPGTGIGLATAQRVIHRHGGHIWAEAEPGKGACFYFTL